MALDTDFINAQLRRRQGGYGRGGRQRIESDAVTILGGVRLGQTTGAPLVIQIPNKDNRLDDLRRTPPVYRPRPGHADLAGAMKWLTSDCRNTLERASARETAGRTAAGAVARCLLREFGITTFGFVRGLLDAITDVQPSEDNLDQLVADRDSSEPAPIFSRTQAEPGAIAPLLGEHTDEILGEAGFSPDQIAEMREAGAIG